MKPFSITFALAVVLLAGNSAFGQFILTLDVVQRTHSMHDQKDQRENLASISVSVKPDDKFFAKASVGGETVKLEGIVKPTKDGHFEVIANPSLSKRTADDRIAFASVQTKATFDRKLTLTAKSNLATQVESGIERARIRLENKDANTESDGTASRWLGDTLVVGGGGLVEKRVTPKNNELIRTYFYLRLKETNDSGKYRKAPTTHAR